MYVQVRRAKKLLFFGQNLSRAKNQNDPPVTKIRLRASCGVYIRTRCRTFCKKLFLAMFMLKQKKREIFTVCSGPTSQSIGRGRISREGALDVRESRERRDKIVPIFSPEKRNFGLKFYTFFEQDRLFSTCCLRESTSVWQNFRQKQPKKKKKKKWGLRFFQNVGVRIPFSMGNFHFFKVVNRLGS